MPGHTWLNVLTCLYYLFSCKYTYLCCLSAIRSKLLRWCITQPGDSCRRACLGRLLHQVSLSWWPGCRLLGGKPSRHLFPPQKLYARTTVHPAKLILSVSREPSGILKYTIFDGWSAIHHLSLPTCCTLHPRKCQWSTKHKGSSAATKNVLFGNRI